MKIKTLDLICVLLFYAVFKISTMPTWLQQTTKIISIIIVLLFLLTHLKLKTLINPAIPLCIVIIISNIYSYSSGVNNFRNILNAVLFSLCLYCICSLCIYCFENACFNIIIDNFYRMTMIYCLISIVSIMILGTSNNRSIYYFAGNKFTTGYLFIQLVALFWIRYYESIEKRTFRKPLLIAFVFLSIVISGWIYCSTSFMASIFVLIYLILPGWFRSKLQNWKIVIAAIIISGGIVIAFSTIMSIPQVNRLIINVLGESATLNGREKIYLNVISIISRRKWLGYGYGSNIVIKIVGYGNAQNGIFQVLIENGIIGCLTFFGTIFICTCGNSLSSFDGLYALLYAMIFASIVEISFDYGFYFSLFAIYAVSDKRRKKPIKNKSEIYSYSLSKL